MARKKRSDAGKPRTDHAPLYAVQDAPKPVEKGKQVSDGPTTGYRDADGGKVERKTFVDGWLPSGWHDTPAACENCDGNSHPEYVEA